MSLRPRRKERAPGDRAEPRCVSLRWEASPSHRRDGLQSVSGNHEHNEDLLRPCTEIFSSSEVTFRESSAQMFFSQLCSQGKGRERVNLSTAQKTQGG